MLILAEILLVVAIALNVFECIKQEKLKINTRLNCCSTRLSMIALSAILQIIGIIQSLGNLSVFALAIFGVTFIYMVITLTTLDFLVHIKIFKNERVG